MNRKDKRELTQSKARGSAQCPKRLLALRSAWAILGEKKNKITTCLQCGNTDITLIDFSGVLASYEQEQNGISAEALVNNTLETQMLSKKRPIL